MSLNYNAEHFFRISGEIMCITSTVGLIQRVNPAFERALGYKEEEVCRKSFYDFIHIEDIPLTKEKFENFIKLNLKTSTFEVRVRDIRGSYKWLAFTNIDHHNDSVYATLRNITKTKAKKELLKTMAGKFSKQSELLDTVLNAIPEFVCILNEDLRFIYINRFAAKIFNMPQNVFMGKSLEELGIHYDNLASYKQEVAEVFRTGRMVFDIMHLEMVGEQKQIEYSIVPIQEEGCIQGIIYTARDITQKNKDRKNFEASEKKLKKIIDLVPYPIFLKDKEYRYTMINKAQADLFQTTIENLLGKTDEEFIKAKNELDTVISSDEKIIKEQISVVLPEQIITDPHGNKVILHTTKIPFLNEIDNTINILGISIDITSVKNAEEELLRTNFELDSFVYKSSHDLRAPLRSLIGLLSLARKEQDVEMRNHILDRSNKSIAKLDAFISELTNFSRNSRLELTAQKIHFETIIRECIENLKFMEHAQKVDIQLNIIENAGFYSDPSRITILFMNLISNAIKYQNPQNHSPRVTIEVYTDRHKAFIMVSDNGIGIEKEFHGKIFDMFFRASEKSFGSGLGLYIVKQVVDKLSGGISLQSEPREGSVFKIDLPSLKANHPSYLKM